MFDEEPDADPLKHHHWHLETGVILKIPTGDGDFVEMDNAEEYADSALYEQTAIALSPGQGHEPCPTCGGKGTLPNPAGAWGRERCPACNGTGKKEPGHEI